VGLFVTCYLLVVVVEEEFYRELVLLMCQWLVLIYRLSKLLVALLKLVVLLLSLLNNLYGYRYIMTLKVMSVSVSQKPT